ncbi:peptidylprolyl isomerase/peptidyl-prolyl cis-trans isomerase D [Tenacibaculum skagerrakense]|uniref:Periplasmic chaperone PpiD n=1 Tax=Tenacibaculum skagerrakense TaxID=186571 RepID=A0A4R2P3F2_9FLAO|nr:peptidylprolyl isomerase [Tenacibaculum skagerrakense]TCP28544.1 peptidylprolyl isomerase/peptidyl-prolyl cis-trans isomerase D [Tenacibaculum skagerrakense]
MAILSKIRERSWLLILIVGLALFSFVLDPSTLSDFFNSTKMNEVGEVNGETITRQEFAEALDNYKRQTGNRVSEMQAAKTVWNNLLRQKVYESQLAEAGITVGEADILKALYETEFIKNDPRFSTTGVFDKEKFKEFLATIKVENGEEWANWRQYMASVKSNLQKTTYDNLVAAGLGASLKEGENEYLTENTKINANLVFLSYTSVPDSSITVTRGEIKKYIENHPSEFEVEASRDIRYVKFNIKATPEDEAEIKAGVAKLIEDSTNKQGQIVPGLKSTTDYKLFFEETNSDLPLNDKVQFKGQVPQIIAEDLFNGKAGDVFGPYKDQGFFKLSKITEVLNVPDSVKSSHILIPFVGGMRADASVTRTEEQAKKTADSIYNLVKNNSAKFKQVADEVNTDGTKGKGGEIGWTTYNVGFSPNFDEDFAKFIFNNKKGDVQVVKTKFGYHIIKIDDQKKEQKALKLATFGRKIEASEITENAIFQDAETFALEISKGTSIDEAAKQKELTALPAVGLKALDENVPGLGNQREIITWAFGKDVTEGDYKRFDVEGGYVVATLTTITEKGLEPVDKAINKVRPILLNEKKAEILKGKFSTGSTLEEIASSNKQTLRSITDVNLSSPTITGIGFEPKVVGAMLNAKENELVKEVVGDRGVYAFVVTGKELPTALPNYDTYRKRIANQRKNQTFNMYEAIKKASDIEDGVSSFYGIDQ